MEKKETQLPRMCKTFTSKDQLPAFKLKTLQGSKEKQNKGRKSVENARAKNTINKIKSFNSPELIMALNDSIRIQTSLIDNECRNQRSTNYDNKTFHSFNSFHQTMNASQMLKSKELSRVHYKYRPYCLEREKVIELKNWIQEKLQKIKQKDNICLDDLIEYNQTIVNYGLGQIIESVKKKCKEEGELLKMVWDNTFILFENLLNVLSNQLRLKDQQIIDNEKQYESIYQVNLSLLKKKNCEMEKHLDMLYEKMRRVIIWNRRLRRDRFKQEIKIRVQDYRLATYSSALEQATSLLLSQSREPNCLIVAKKIISRLYRQKNQKKNRKERCLKTKNQKGGAAYEYQVFQEQQKKKQRFENCENSLFQQDLNQNGTKQIEKINLKGQKKQKKKKKPLKQEAKQFVHKNARQFVKDWLKKYSLEEDEKIHSAIFLSQDEKQQILELGDQKQIDDIDIYDYFQTKTIMTQTLNSFREQGVQYEQRYVQKKSKNVGVETKRIYKTSVGIQNIIPSETEKNTDENKLKSRKESKKNTLQMKLDKKKQHKQKRMKSGGIPLESEVKIDVDKDELPRKRSNYYPENDENKNDANQDLQNQSGNELNDDIFSDQEIFDMEWDSKKQIFELNELLSSQNLKQGYSFGQNIIQRSGDNRNFGIPSSTGLIKEPSNNFHSPVKFKRKEKKATVVSQRVITETDEKMYQTKGLNKKIFDETYQSQMRNEYQGHKDEFIRSVMRKRSFYKALNRPETKQKTIIGLWYRPNKYLMEKQKKDLNLNRIDEEIYNYFNYLNKNFNLPANYNKSKLFQQNCSFFTAISTNLINNNLQRNVPKNKQFINLSVMSITKFISRLILDYLRKIRGEIEGIFIESQRVYNPLSVILVDHMMHKYGLRDIAEKKLRDFMEKIANFVEISDRISFFYRLLGVGEEFMSADELNIYMKCLVHFDIGKTIPIMNITKDFSVQRASTDKETVLAQVDEIIKQFFRENMREQIKWKIERYFHLYQPSGPFEIEKIASMLIDQFLLLKKQEYCHYLPIHKNCQGNFFPNLLKTVQILSINSELRSRYTKMVQQIYKGADLIDEVWGKSISQLKFIGLCIKLGFPKYSEIHQRMLQLKNKVLVSLKLEQSAQETEQLLLKIKKRYNIRIGIQKQAPDYQTWTWAQIGNDVSQINSYQLIGQLKWAKGFKTIGKQ